MKLWFYWLVLITTTIAVALLNVKNLPYLIILLTIGKLLIVSEVFMELKHAPIMWRAAMQLYSVVIPVTCFFIINF